MPGVCPWGMLKLQFARYIKVCNYYTYIFIVLKNVVNISLGICLLLLLTIIVFIINTQVIIQNRALSLARYLGLPPRRTKWLPVVVLPL